MSKIVRRIPLNVRKARRKDMCISREIKKRLSVKYPNCIGTFPECKDLKVGQLGSSCQSCPHFSEQNYRIELNKLNGGIEMKAKKEHLPNTAWAKVMLRVNEAKKEHGVPNWLSTQQERKLKEIAKGNS